MPGKPAVARLLIGIAFAGAGLIFILTDHVAIGIGNLVMGIIIAGAGLKRPAAAPGTAPPPGSSPKT